MLTGQIYSVQFFYPNDRTPFTSKITGIVTDSVEIPDSSIFNITTLDAVHSSIDISDSRIKYQVESGSNTFASSNYNGFRFGDEAGRLPRIVGVDVLSNSTASLPDGRIQFSDDFISVNVAGQRYSAGYSVDIEVRFDENLTGRPSEGVLFSKGGGGDYIRGNTGNDVFRFDSSEQDTFVGGSGFDTLRVDGAAWNYRIYIADGINTYVSEINPNASVASEIQVGALNRLMDVERIQFSNGALALDVGYAEKAGTAYRTYQAAFGREPDLPGLGFHIRNLDNGVSFADMANGFVNSPEFLALYGQNVSNTAYVNLLYQNVLGRAGDAGGVAYWNSLLDSGRASKNDVLIGFADSPENISLTQSVTSDGIWFI